MENDKGKIGNRILTKLPLWENGKNKGSVKWKATVGMELELLYKSEIYKVKVIKYENKKIWIDYNGYIYDKGINIDSFKNYRFGRVLKLVTNEFKYEIGNTIIDDKRDLIITDREYRKSLNHKNTNLKWYKYTCNRPECGWTEGWIEESKLKEGKGCSCCHGRTVVLGINTIWDTDRWMCDLGVSEEDAKRYSKGSHDKIEVTCPNCGNKKKILVYNILCCKSIGCTCGDGFSYPEKLMSSILTQLGVRFEMQYSPDYLIPLGGKKYRKFSDFYLPDCKLIVETDGEIGHSGGYIHSKSNKTLEENIATDKWKDEQHKLNGLDTVRINCFKSDIEYIKNSILNSKLNEIFDLSGIDWNSADLYAIKSNKIKEVCDYWNNKEEWETTTDLGERFNCWNSTINTYLKKGTKLGWCNYDPKEELKKISTKNGKTTGNPVAIYNKHGDIITIESSSRELARKSMLLLSEKFTQSGISIALKEKRMYKDYKITNVSKQEYQEYLNSQTDIS